MAIAEFPSPHEAAETIYKDLFESVSQENQALAAQNAIQRIIELLKPLDLSTLEAILDLYQQEVDIFCYSDDFVLDQFSLLRKKGELLYDGVITLRDDRSSYYKNPIFTPEFSLTKLRKPDETQRRKDFTQLMIRLADILEKLEDYGKSQMKYADRLDFNAKPGWTLIRSTLEKPLGMPAFYEVSGEERKIWSTENPVAIRFNFQAAALTAIQDLKRHKIQ